MWLSGNRSDFRSWGASATKPALKENVIHDSANRPVHGLKGYGHSGGGRQPRQPPWQALSDCKMEEGTGHRFDGVDVSPIE
jgi:hypothetical protein